MEKKKHVLCEKVMASNEQEALSMIECAKKNHVVLLEAMRPDFDPAFDMIKNALPRIGKIRRASFEFCQYSSRYDRFKDGIIENALILHSETPLYQTSEFIVFIPLSAFSVHLKTFILCLPHWKTILNAAALF